MARYKKNQHKKHRSKSGASKFSRVFEWFERWLMALRVTWRFQFTVVLIFGMGFALVGWEAWMQFDRGDFLRDQGDRRSVRLQSIEAHRGVIRDRHGKPLAVSTPVVSIWANPKLLLESQVSLLPLAKALEQPLSDLSAKLQKRAGRSFFYLARHLPPEQAETVLALKLTGIYGKKEYKRYYPAGEMAAHLVGITKVTDETGQEGVELAYDRQLQGIVGQRRVLKDRYGRVIRDMGVEKTAQPGNDVHLSIDLRMQYVAYRSLRQAVEKHEAKTGSLVVMDVKTGEVLAMVNQPSFNPNNRKSLSVSAMRNRVVTDVFEPGSTMKTLVIGAALESGLMTPETLIDTSPGYIYVGRKQVLDHRNYGVLSLTEVLTKSSNVASVKLSQLLGGKAIRDAYANMGFGADSGVGLPGESSGFLPNPKHWKAIEEATLSYGYGVSVNVLQLAKAYGAIAHGGVSVPASILKINQAKASTPVLSSETSSQLLSMLETVVSEEGTAKRAAVEDFRVAGKTGTVHKLKNGRYMDNSYHSVFVGVAPASNPEVVMAVVVHDPKGGAYYGGEVAAPAFSHAMRDILRLAGSVPDDPHHEDALSAR